MSSTQNTVIPFNGIIKSIGTIATIKNDNGTLSFALEKSDIQCIFNSGNNIGITSGTINTSTRPKFDTVTINTEPSNDNDAVTVKYVNDRVNGLDITGLNIKESVALSTTEDISLNNTTTFIDGVTVSNGDRILVKHQTDAKENGIYVVNNGVWTRASDFNNGDEVKNVFVFVENGTVNAAKGFIQSNPGFATIGQDDITFTQFNGTYAFDAGAGLSKEGNTLNIESSLNFVNEMTGLTTIGSNEGTIHIASIITGPTITDISGNLSSEIARAIAQEDDISGNLSMEIARAIAQEDDISGNLSSEIARAIAAEELKANLTGAEFTGDVIVTSNLSVNGTTTTTTINTTTLDVSDSLISVNTGNTKSSGGILFDRVDASNAVMGWDEDENKFMVGFTNAINSQDDIGIVTKGVILADLSGNVDKATTAIHSENIMLEVLGGDVIINGNVSVPEGPNFSKFMMDYNGNFIINVNNLYFKYNLSNVSDIYNGDS